MPLLKVNKTVPELFEFLTEEYANRTKSFVMMHKVDGKYIGITYNKFKEETENLAFGLASLGINKFDMVVVLEQFC